MGLPRLFSNKYKRFFIIAMMVYLCYKCLLIVNSANDEIQIKERRGVQHVTGETDSNNVEKRHLDNHSRVQETTTTSRPTTPKMVPSKKPPAVLTTEAINKNLTKKSTQESTVSIPSKKSSNNTKVETAVKAGFNATEKQKAKEKEVKEREKKDKDRKAKETKRAKDKTDEKVRWQNVIKKYLEEHRNRCEKDWVNRTLPPGSKPLCDCVPNTLVPFVDVKLDEEPKNRTFPNLIGGHWEPEDCTPRSRLVIIIPFRDRQHHLDILLQYLHPILQGQKVNYTILVPEQLSPAIFNKASLMNVGFEYAMNVHEPDCVVFHDVDHVPEDGRHFYYCRDSPIHLGAFHSRHAYRVIYGNIFGAVTAFAPKQFRKINGFSNRYFGWGGEDDDMSMRVRENKYKVIRDPREVAGYKVVKHMRDKGNRNPNRGAMIHRLFKDRDTNFDGLNSLRYVFEKKVYYNLYEWIGVHLLNTDVRLGFNLNEAS